MFCIVFAWLVICSRVEGEPAMVVRVGLHEAEQQILVFTDVRKKNSQHQCADSNDAQNLVNVNMRHEKPEDRESKDREVKMDCDRSAGSLGLRQRGCCPIMLRQ
jgi:hypothetical protein